MSHQGNDAVKINTREWEALMRTLDSLMEWKQRSEREDAVRKAKMSLYVWIIGGAIGAISSLVMTVVTHFIMKALQ